MSEAGRRQDEPKGGRQFTQWQAQFHAAAELHLRTTSLIESTFVTVRLREGVTKGSGSRTAGLTMTFRLLQVVDATGAARAGRRCDRRYSAD